jgi:hypothetical protein
MLSASRCAGKPCAEPWPSSNKRWFPAQGRFLSFRDEQPRPAGKATYRRTGVGQDARPVDASMAKANPSKKLGIE